MKKVEDIFRETIKRYSLLKRKDRLLLGLSGGPDSVFMLYQFLGLRQEYKLHLVCVHFNHSLRKEADGEEQFIKELCVREGIKCISEKKDVNKFFKGDSLEQTARNLRFDFFLKCSRQVKIKKIALAHHKDDLIETVLMRMIRGSGLKGLQAFLPKSKFRSLNVIRPLIDITKDDILKWLKDKKIPYCLDKSNFEEKFLRNRIRIKLLPLLREFNPNIRENLSSLSRSVSLDYDFIYTYSQRKFLDLKRKETARSLHLGLEGLKELPPAVFNNVIRIAVEELKGNTRLFEARHLDEIRDLVYNRPARSIVDLPGLSAKKEEKTLLIQSLIL